MKGMFVLRLSEVFSNSKYKDTTEMMFFHGTSTMWMPSFLKNGIKITKVKDKKKDFGQGFYVTTRYWQAKDYANRIAGATNSEPLIIACVIPLGALRAFDTKGLIIDNFDDEWLDIITRGRFKSETTPLANDFHWIYGRCGDGATRDFEDGYRKGKDLKKLLPHIIPNVEFPHYNYDQLWLGTYDAINCIQSVEFISREGVKEHVIPIHK
jgi:hypothetical protein